MTCPNCGAGVDDRSRFCNYCGHAQQAAPPAQPPAYEYQPPQPPSQGIAPALGGKTYLILSLCCFGWAGLVGLPRCVGLLISLFRWDLGFSGFFSLGMNLVLPLVLGAALLNMHRRNNC